MILILTFYVRFWGTDILVSKDSRFGKYFPAFQRILVISSSESSSSWTTER